MKGELHPIFYEPRVGRAFLHKSDSVEFIGKGGGLREGRAGKAVCGLVWSRFVNIYRFMGSPERNVEREVNNSGAGGQGRLCSGRCRGLLSMIDLYIYTRYGFYREKVA